MSPRLIRLMQLFTKLSAPMSTADVQDGFCALQRYDRSGRATAVLHQYYNPKWGKKQEG